jgi:phage major head subunit gpT-like protein
MAINTTQIANLLRPGLAAVFGDYPQYPSQWSEIFEVYHSDKAVEIEEEMKMLGLAQIRPEGAPTAVDSMQQAITTSYVHKFVGLSFAITQQAMEDNLYKSKFPLMVRALKKSLAQTKEILGASILNNGFNAAFPIGDGQPLFSLNHPITAGGVVANTPVVQADLSEASLEAAIVTVQQFKDQAGLIIQTKPLKLIVPPQGQFTAERLLQSSFRVGTQLNDINALYNLQMVPQGYRVNQYLTPYQPNAWYLLTDAPDGFKHYVRTPVKTDVYTEFSTDNLLAKAVERYSFGVSNFRAAYGSNGP